MNVYNQFNLDDLITQYTSTNNDVRFLLSYMNDYLRSKDFNFGVCGGSLYLLFNNNPIHVVDGLFTNPDDHPFAVNEYYDNENIETNLTTVRNTLRDYVDDNVLDGTLIDILITYVFESYFYPDSHNYLNDDTIIRRYTNYTSFDVRVDFESYVRRNMTQAEYDHCYLDKSFSLLNNIVHTVE